MLIGTGRGQQKRGIVARFLVPTCIVMNKNVFMCMHWIALNVFKLVLALQKLFQNNYHRRKAKNRIFTKSTDTVTVLISSIISEFGRCRFCMIEYFMTKEQIQAFLDWNQLKVLSRVTLSVPLSGRILCIIIKTDLKS